MNHAARAKTIVPKLRLSGVTELRKPGESKKYQVMPENGAARCKPAAKFTSLHATLRLMWYCYRITLVIQFQYL